MAMRIKLADYIERKNDAGAIIIELADGAEISVPPAELWPDEAYAALDSSNVVEAVRLILGDDQYEAFGVAGGNWRILNGIVDEMQGLDAGKSAASSQSSASSAMPSNPTSSAGTKSISRRRSAPKSSPTDG